MEMIARDTWPILASGSWLFGESRAKTFSSSENLGDRQRNAGTGQVSF